MSIVKSLWGKEENSNSAVAKNLIRSEDCDRMSPLFDVSTFRDFYAKRDDLVFELFLRHKRGITWPNALLTMKTQFFSMLIAFRFVQQEDL